MTRTQNQTRSQNQTDADLKIAIVAELSWTPSVNGANVGVAVNRGAVTLSGEVDSFPERRIAEQAAMRVPGVTAIAQEITVRSNWGTGSDTDLARDAGAAVDRAVDVPTGAVQIVVTDHRITLSGAVPWHYQREAAMRAVQYLKGVDAVVNTIQLQPAVAPLNLKTEIRAALVRIAEIEGEQLGVTADAAGAVTLQGHVRTWSERAQAERLAWSAPGVTEVHNQLSIRV